MTSGLRPKACTSWSQWSPTAVVIIYAPHIDEISYTHGHVLDEESAITCTTTSSNSGIASRDIHGARWPIQTVRGIGTYDAATGIGPNHTCRSRCAAGHPRRALPPGQPRLSRPGQRRSRQAVAGRENEGILLVPHAGEMLYRLRQP